MVLWCQTRSWRLYVPRESQSPGDWLRRPNKPRLRSHKQDVPQVSLDLVPRAFLYFSQIVFVSLLFGFLFVQVFGVCPGGDWTQQKSKCYGCYSQWGHCEVHSWKVCFSLSCIKIKMKVEYCSFIRFQIVLKHQTVLIALTYDNIMFHKSSDNLVCFSNFFRMNEMGLSPTDNKVYFGQLLGMCDQISFPLGTLRAAQILKANTRLWNQKGLHHSLMWPQRLS